jgi:hypothetical protein
MDQGLECVDRAAAIISRTLRPVIDMRSSHRCASHKDHQITASPQIVQTSKTRKKGEGEMGTHQSED